ncbi:MAG: MBL fold metallo-hydrolase [Pirellulales bacterium]|nr:MBL fold metallo-hydrolase [Pirellulales bacterium]
MKGRFVFAAVVWLVTSAGTQAKTPGPSIEITQGPVNRVVIRTESQAAAIYGAAEATASEIDWVLLPHHRRDVLWAARPLVEAGVKAVAPAAERELIESPQNFWNDFRQKRFHDYQQQSTKILEKPLAVNRWVKEGDQLDLGGVTLTTLETPGFTRGSVSYATQVDGKKYVFTGDLIAGAGKVLDIYSFQDAIPAAGVRGYHGYGGRFAALLASLEKVKALQPDVLVPARGEVMTHPEQALQSLADRVRALYRSYLSTSALNWYFKEERMGICARRVLGENTDFSWMAYSAHDETPDWIWVKGTSRLVISETGHSLLIDCGTSAVIDGVKELMNLGVIEKVDGIFVTHYHDDHTDAVEAARKAFACPVYAVENYGDILQHPGNYHMPCLHHTPIEDLVVKQDGDKLPFHEFTLTFRRFPGQTFYHGALLVEHPGQTPVFFIGDAFSPSGMDDYCVLNRNLMHNDDGLLNCLGQIRELGDNYWLINEHISQVFRFSRQELAALEAGFRERAAIVRQLSPWDDENYAVDEQWACLYPYGVHTKPAAIQPFEVKLTNHSPKPRDYRVRFRLPAGAQLMSKNPGSALVARNVPPGGLATLPVKIQLPARPGNYLVRVDVQSDGIDVRDWVESLVTIGPDETNAPE